MPLGVPSELLERRPDIASAERQVAAANEQIGIAMAAFYPNLTLTGSGGLEQLEPGAMVHVAELASGRSGLHWLSHAISTRASAAGVVAEQRAAYDATVAAYRQTVLTAMQQVEDNLAALRILAVGGGRKCSKPVEAAQSSARHLRGAITGRHGELSDGHHLASHAAERQCDCGISAVDSPPDRERAC